MYILFQGSKIPRPALQEPFWLKNVEVTPQLMYGYQVSFSMRNQSMVKGLLAIGSTAVDPNWTPVGTMLIPDTWILDGPLVVDPRWTPSE